MPATKTCLKCRQPKPLDAFFWRNRRLGYVSSYCKICEQLYVRDWKRANRTRALFDEQNPDGKVYHSGKPKLSTGATK